MGIAQQEKAFLEEILNKLESNFVAKEDRLYIKKLTSQILDIKSRSKQAEVNAPKQASLAEISGIGYEGDISFLENNSLLRRILEHAKHKRDTENIAYKIGDDFLSAEQIEREISKYMGQDDFSKYLNNKDYKYLNSISGKIKRRRNLSAKEVIETERIFTKAEQRKANEDAGAVYFNPSGLSPGGERGIYYKANYIINFLLGRYIGLGPTKGKCLIQRVDGDDVLEVRKKYFLPEGGIEEMRARLEKRREQQKRRNPDTRGFEAYEDVLKLLTEYFTRIDPAKHKVIGLKYAIPKDGQVPFPDAF